MNKQNFIIKGHMIWSRDRKEMTVKEDHYLVVSAGIIQGVFPQVPAEFAGLEMLDYTGHLVIPGLTDLHIHGPQYVFRGLSMDRELLDWLNFRTFPEEAKYRDPEYARRAYRLFAQDLRQGGTVNAVVFGTIHKEGTRILMEELEAAGLRAYVGKVNMDRNSPDDYREETEDSAADTRAWIQETAGAFSQVKPILTPRFLPTCSDRLMELLGQLQREFALPVQSHLSENQGEIAWVRELCPQADFYGDGYQRFGLFGGDVPTIMAHCVYSGEEELLRMKERGVYIAHCPQSNTNIASGIAPVRRFLDMGIRVGLGSDVAGGHSASIFRTMAEAVQVSKLRWRLVDQTLRPLTAAEAFYLGTEGGGSFFGRSGSFQKGYAADILVLDESRMPYMEELTVAERLERYLYLCGEKDILHKFVGGRMLF